MKKILYLGDQHYGATSRHRANALRRIGYDVKSYDPSEVLSLQHSSSLINRLHYHSGYRFVQRKFLEWISFVLSEELDSDIVWVDGGEYFGRKCLEIMRTLSVPIVLFNHDDPTGPRDARRFYSLKKALPLYTAVTAVREDSFRELAEICHGKVIKIARGYDEVEHSPDLPSSELIDRFRSDVCFIGTWMRNEGRDKFLLSLIERDLEVSIWGYRWQKSPYWHRLKKYWRGNALSGPDYVAAIQGAKICLGLLSKGNRDLHTTRSMEIPYAGGLLCAERTKEHLEFYSEGSEAVFWSSVDECADICHNLLEHDTQRELIRSNGMARVRSNRVGNEDICREILEGLSL